MLGAHKMPRAITGAGQGYPRTNDYGVAVWVGVFDGVGVVVGAGVRG